MILKFQYRKLCRMLEQGKTLQEAADKSGMDVKTARKYSKNDNPFYRPERNWKTRKNPFEEVWEEIEGMLKVEPGLEAKTIFEHILEKYPGSFQEGQLRTLQRKVKAWKVVYGEPKEVFFEQKHKPGDLSASDFTHMNELRITIEGSPFTHMVYHFVLTYSNWEDITICYSENLESLLDGLQNAFWRLGGVPKRHRTDRLSAAIKNLGDKNQFTQRYQELMDFYGIKAEKIQPCQPNENGDVEQAHHRFKKAVDQALMLRGSRDFSSIEEYQKFLMEIVAKRNGAKETRLGEEKPLLSELPKERLMDWSELKVKVSRGSTIRAKDHTYSVPSNLIGEMVDVRVNGSAIGVYYGGKLIEEMPRLTGSSKARINYRHIIDWLVRKPGAFEHYRYKEELYPSSTFRAAYDALRMNCPKRANKEYLGLLKASSINGELRVEAVLKKLLSEGEPISLDKVEELLNSPEKVTGRTEVFVAEVNLGEYDSLLRSEGGQR